MGTTRQKSVDDVPNKKVLAKVLVEHALSVAIRHLQWKGSGQKDPKYSTPEVLQILTDAEKYTSYLGGEQ